MTRINFLLLILPVILLCKEVEAQISPGDLSKAHSEFEGISNCTKCHVMGEKVAVSKCLDCHTDIKKTLDAGRGFHSGPDVRGKNCWSCHSEHHGKNFRLINFNKDKFTHERTGFVLTGAHSRLNCGQCHQSKFITSSDIKKKSGTYQGLSQNCSTCHTDYHQSTLGTNCNNCHNTDKFIPAAGFSHEKAAFKLTGMHTKTECIKCHPKENRNGKSFQKFKSIAFSSCSSCHKDVHMGKFGTNCQQCHVTASFKQINQTAFDHNKTNFPLKGKHITAACTSCHKTGLSSKPLYQKCTDCHQDYHKGQFTQNNILKDCSECHTENGFSPSLFTIDNHKSKFPLTGAHLAVPCQNCHLKQQEWVFKSLPAECKACHQNVHGNEIAARYMPGDDCGSCHLTESWHTISFDHSKTDYPLSGKHSTAGCRDCHYRENSQKIKEYRFASLTADCVNCHKDIHSGQFAAAKGEPDCIRCHTYDNWIPTRFDHNNSKFPLDGAHQKVKCSECHKTKTINGNQVIEFKLKDFKCASCHS